MLRSRYHRPWQPRANDGQALNPFAHSSGSETSFSDDIEQAEDEVRVAQEGHSADVGQSLGEAVPSDPNRPATPPAPAPRTRWYEHFRDRFRKH